jgi:L-ascorbate metabolism protein UlaG (beta-lactamase superfamily)
MDLQGLKLTWLGHASALIQTTAGQHVLIDPFIKDNPAMPNSKKNLKSVDVMLITHGHGDHLADAVEIAQKHKPKVVGIYELCAWLQKKGVENTMPMNKGGSQMVGDIRVTMVNASHSSGIDDGGQTVYGGEPCGYVIEFENGLKIYHAGDTCVFGDMHIIHELYHPDIALLPIGDLFTMGPQEAAYACHLLKPKAVIPIHWGTWPILTGKPNELKKLVEGMGIEVVEMKPGQTI